jgi:hypothetical protein
VVITKGAGRVAEEDAELQTSPCPNPAGVAAEGKVTALARASSVRKSKRS